MEEAEQEVLLRLRIDFLGQETFPSEDPGKLEEQEVKA